MKNILKVAIVDDCPYDIEKTTDALKIMSESPEFKNIKMEVTIYTQPTVYLEQNKKYDFILLDVEMPVMNGFELAERLIKEQPNTLIIFLTSHNEKMRYGYQYRAHRYVTKPIDPADFDEAILSAIKQTASLGQIKAYRDNKSFYLELKDILNFEADKHGSLLFTTDGKEYSCKQSLKELESLLPSWLFWRAHKYYIINMDYYTSLDTKESVVIVESSYVTKKLEVSREKRKKLDKAINYYRRMKGRI